MEASQSPILLGYIGTGIAAHDLHWPALTQLTHQFKVHAVCNRTRSKAENFAQLSGASFIYDTPEQLLADKDVEAVVIAAPIELNHSLVMQALAFGKHVLVEKPLAASLTQAWQLAELEQQTDRITLLAENFRYHPAFHEIARIMSEGMIGDVFSFFWNGYNRLIPGDKYATPWRLNHQYPGGYVMDGGIHNIAAIRMLFGELDTFRAQTLAVNPEIGTIDTLHALFSLQSGVTGQLNLCFSTNGFSENRLVILGNKGSIGLENDTLVVKSGNEVIHSATFDFFDSYRNQFDDFYTCIRTGKAPFSSFAQGVSDLEFMMQLID